MVDNSPEILEESNKIIQKLSDLTIFFEDRMIMNIYVQTQVIHKLFEDNPDIDINKLELFHLQFTSTLIELLEKIKKRNERIVNMFKNEIQLNLEIINKIREGILKDGGYDAGKQTQTRCMSASLRGLYTAIYNQSKDYPFGENINLFSIKFYKEYFYEISTELMASVTNYDKSLTYRQPFATIDKKLLLALGQSNFAVKFFAGIKAGSLLVEIYQILNMDVYFLFISARNIFLPCDINVFPVDEWEDVDSKREQTIKELREKNKELENNITHNLKLIDKDISQLLQENYKKITDLDFLSSMENIDSQANILKSMLETKII